MAKVEYIRCPRCELNYINKKDKLCKVCQMELQTKGTNSTLESEELELGICPICKTNYISEDETMCAMCAQEKELEDERVGGIVDENENWRMYVDNEDEETEEDEVGDMSSISEADDDMLAEDLGMTIDDEDEMEEDFEEDDDYGDDLDDDLDDLDDDFDDDDLDGDDFDDED